MSRLTITAGPATTPPRKFITRDELCSRWGISRATSYRLEKDGYLRKPFRLGRGVSRWPVDEVEAIERRAAEDRGVRP
jgi:predicted DNA-binding transcriptional regulator AlpA